ncbi:MAG: 3-mercaptopyruvate sulfurtransferase [Arsenophonus sp.]|nr:MAG: 3-mercaptopyruvate sulfurtransferase [Arsenophonus sp.]
MYKRFFVTPKWLYDHITDKNVVILDVSTKKPLEKINYQHLFYKKHIPSAQFFNLDIFDKYTHLPHMLPDKVTFSNMVEELGISNTHQVIIYDQGDLFSAPRAWWNFKIFGCNHVKILSGGLSGWEKAGYFIKSGISILRKKQRFIVRYVSDYVLSKEEVLSLLWKPNIQFIDARATARFDAKKPEPRPGLRMGHIPGSKNVPWFWLVNKGCYKKTKKLNAIFYKQGVDIRMATITSCGSGMTAAVVLLALVILGNNQVKLYDGSWAEWGKNNNLPIE